MENRKTLLVSYALSFIVSALTAITVPIIPLLAIEFNASQFEIGLIGSAAQILYVPTALVIGRASDKVGRKNIIEVSLFLYMITLLTYYLSNSWILLLFGKLLEGFSLAMLWPPVEALISNASLDQKKTTSRFGVAWSSGSITGSLISAYFLELANKKLAFIFNATIVILSLLTFLLVAKEEKKIREDKERIEFDFNILKYKDLILYSFMYSFFQGIVFSLYPAFVSVNKLSTSLIVISLTSIMIARTLAFYFIGMEGIKIEKSLGNLLCLSIFLLPIINNAILVAVVSFLLGIGLGIVYASALKEALDVESSSKGTFTGIFEGSIGFGYIFGSFLGGAVAEINISFPYFFASLLGLILYLVIKIKR